MSLMNHGFTDRSLTATASSQTALTANKGRTYLFIQNIDPGSDVAFVRFQTTPAVTAAAADTPGNIRLSAGAYIEWVGDGLVPTQAMFIIGSAASVPVTILEG